VNTLTRQQVNVKSATQERPTSGRRFGRTILTWLLRLGAGLLVTLSLLPVALLPVATAVPFLLFLLLVVLDGGLLLAALRAGAVGPRLAFLGGIVVTGVAAVLLSQWFATTPPIAGADGKPLPGSIAELTAVELNGRQQWLTLRGEDEDNPVLLFLAGGPGGSQLAATRKKLGALEAHFVVANWDQPGAGKSYGAADFATLTPEQYIADAHELTLYLRDRFDEEKIYILGESWGSLLGTWLVQRYPEHYHAFVGAAQMVAFLETDTYDYDLALQIARERGDSGKVDALRQQGPPPYYGDGVAKKVVEYIMYLSSYMNGNPEIHTNYDTFGDIAAPEYGLYDKVNYVRGLLRTMEAIWPQLWDVDLRVQAPRLETPVYFLEGRHDVNAPPHLVEDYLQTLQAPRKELIWFEHSGHSPWVEESSKVVDVMINTVLGQQ
jgi:pimeloyl-ACP methyl ester carboxylesterase